MSPVSKLGTFPTGASLDSRGNGWVVGDLFNIHQRWNKYGSETTPTGEAWAAFRPAGRPFQPAVSLSHAPEGTLLSPLVASNAAGVSLIAWTSEHGSYLAWATTEGRILTPVFIGHNFSVVGIGVDEQGRALVVGEYTTVPIGTGTGSSVAVVTASTYRVFSHPRTIARPPSRHRKGVVGFTYEPDVAFAPDGGAIITSRRPGPVATASAKHSDQIYTSTATPTVLLTLHADCPKDSKGSCRETTRHSSTTKGTRWSYRPKPPTGWRSRPSALTGG